MARSWWSIVPARGSPGSRSLPSRQSLSLPNLFCPRAFSPSTAMPEECAPLRCRRGHYRMSPRYWFPTSSSCEQARRFPDTASGRTIGPPTPAASAACWQARLSDCDCPTAETRDTVITLAGSSACSCYCDTTPRFEQKRVGRAREGTIGGSSGTGGPSGVIAQADLSE